MISQTAKQPLRCAVEYDNNRVTSDAWGRTASGTLAADNELRTAPSYLDQPCHRYKVESMAFTDPSHWLVQVALVLEIEVDVRRVVLPHVVEQGYLLIVCVDFLQGREGQNQTKVEREQSALIDGSGHKRATR